MDLLTNEMREEGEGTCLALSRPPSPYLPLPLSILGAEGYQWPDENAKERTYEGLPRGATRDREDRERGWNRLPFGTVFLRRLVSRFAVGDYSAENLVPEEKIRVSELAWN